MTKNTLAIMYVFDYETRINYFTFCAFNKSAEQKREKIEIFKTLEK